MKCLRTCLFLIGILLSFETPSRAEVSKLVVTDVSVTSGTMTVVLNKQLEIRDIKITDNKLILPQNILILSQELNDLVLSAYRVREPASDGVSGSISYKITDVYKVADTTSSTKAQATVVFNETLSIKTSILNSDNEPWVNWPMEFSIQNSIFRKLIEKRVLTSSK